MESWIFYGIIAAIFFGINTVIFKVAIQKGSLSPSYASLAYGAGILITLLAYYFMNPGWQFEWKSTSIAVAAGMTWAVGALALAIALSQKGNISQLAPIYNTNTIIAVILGIIFLKEIPDASQIFRVVSGAVLIVAGAVLVSI